MLPDLGIGQYWFVAPEGADREPDRLDDGVDTFAAAPDAIVVVDEVGLITTVNAQASELFGYARDELVGRPIEILLPARFGEQHVKHRQAFTAPAHSAIDGPDAVVVRTPEER